MKTAELSPVVKEHSQARHTLGAIVKKIEKNLGSAFMSGIEAGICFKIIRDEYLFESEGFETFNDFVKAVYADTGIISVKEVNKLVEMASRMLAIRRRNLPEPTSERQMRPLRRFDPEVAANVWEKAVRHITASGSNVTHASVTEFLENGYTEIEATVVQEEPERKTSWERPQDTEEEGEPMDIDYSDVHPPLEASPITMRYSAESLACLDRVEEFSRQGLLPPSARKGIEDGLIKISDDELRDWGRLDDETFLKDGRLICRNWTFKQAHRFNFSKLTSDSTISDLVYTAIASGYGPKQQAHTFPPIDVDEYQIEFTIRHIQK